MKKWNQNWTSPIRVLLAGAGLAASAMLVPLVVSALAPPANSVIGNQAAAQYTDASGRVQNVQSNQVSTTVAQVGGLTLSNDGVKSAAAGMTVYIPHTLVNSGNGTDTFNITAVDSATLGTYDRIAIFADTNGTGEPVGAALCSTPLVTGVPLCSAGFVQSVPGNGANFPFVVAYTLPSNATTPTTPFNTATVRAESNSTVLYGGDRFAQRTDTVNLTTGTAFSSSKAIKAPAVAAPGASSGGWPVALTGGKASSSTSCATTWTPGLVSTAECTYTVYTISYTNNGGATGSYSMADSLPSGMTFVTGSAVWSGLGGTALVSGTTQGTAPNQILSSFTAVAGTTPAKFTATVSNVAPNVSGTISFVVLVNSTATAGTATTTNTALYKTTDCDAACATTTPPDVPTNSPQFPVDATYKVIAANASTVTVFDGAVPPVKASPDLVVVDTAFLGGKVSFTNYVINKSNVAETFNVAISSTGNTFPAGTTFAFFQLDGLTPLLDTNGDGKVDTGELAVNASKQIVVVASLPSTAAATTGPVDALMTATAAQAPGVFDSVWNRVTSVKSAKVDLTNTPAGNQASTDGTTLVACTPGSNCDLGQGPSSSPTFTKTTTPGTEVSFPIYITNQDTTGDFNLTASLPPGWTVKFVPDPSGTATCAGTEVNPINVPGGTTGPSDPPQANEIKVLACVTPPAGVTPATFPVNFTATKQGDPTVSDTITDAVRVIPPVTPQMQLGPNNSSNTATNGGTVEQPATLTNTGNTSCGQGSGFNVAFSFDSAATAAGWTAVVYFDVNKDGKVGTGDLAISHTAVPNTTANLTSTLPVANSLVPLLPAPGNTLGLPLVVKTFAPTNAVVGSTATGTLTVTDLGAVTAENCGVQAATYSTTVTNGQVRVVKKQALDANCDGTETAFDVANLSVKPGECIVYQVVATNDGNSAATLVSISDTVPNFTTYGIAQRPAQCEATGNTGAPAFQRIPGTPDQVSCGKVAPAVSLAPLGTMTLYYQVKVQE